jgi:2-polyprenyl-6-methoxyphenol hydroxylase-like FAD-dependent oxidoreductase
MKVVVVGSGVAAAAAVIALRGVEGCEVSVVRGDAGGGPPVLALWPNALAALEAVLGSQTLDLSSCSAPLERLDIRGRSGELLWALPAGSLGRGRGPFTPSRLFGGGEPPVAPAFRRSWEPRIVDAPQFKKELWMTVDAGSVTLQSGSDRRVHVLAQDGERYAPDLVVLADGAASPSRAELARWVKEAEAQAAWARPEEATGLVALSGKVNDPGYARTRGLLGPGTGCATQGDGVRFGVVRSPTEQDQLVWYAFLRADMLPHPSAELSELERAAALRALQPLHAPIAEMVAATKPIYARELKLRPPAPPWVATIGAQHVVLLGDAAHAMMPDLGQGCAMAFEDAALLRAALEKQGALTSLDARAKALRRWETQRWQRVERVGRLSAAAAVLGSVRAPSMLREAAIRGPFPVAGLAAFDELLDAGALELDPVPC